ncbi:MAG: hypothetical protein PUB77_04790, partial [Clostridiales bacterium]|nr:hypothetical protein [Clostridiales bacterium]
IIRIILWIPRRPLSEYWNATEAKKRITQKKVSESSGKFWNGRKKQRNGNKFHRLLLSFLSSLSQCIKIEPIN